MKAIIAPRYGSPDVLQMHDLAIPTPKANEVQIQIHAVSVNAADWHLLKADPALVRLQFGLFKPKHAILGADVAGRISAVGAGVTRFAVGDAVFGDVSGAGWGGYAEYTTAPEDVLVHKPASITFAEAAAVPMAAVTALLGLQQGGIQPGQHVLINGASGGVGTFAVQLARAMGAEVTAVCSTRNLELARTLGAHHVIDYTQDDFTRRGQQYDLILAANGYRTLAEYQRALRPNGTYVMVGGKNAQIFEVMLFGRVRSRGSQRMTALMAHPDRNALEFIAALLTQGTVKPVIARRYPLEHTADAIRYVEAGHAQGKVVVTIRPE